MTAGRLGILATHPIQYYAPLYRALAARPGVDLTVYFAHQPTPAEQGIGFGVAFTWDHNLIDGYPHIFLTNRASGPNRDRFRDYDTPSIASIITRGRFDAFLVHGWQTQSYWQAMRACWQSATPVLVRGDSQLRDDASSLKRALKRMLYPRFVRRFAACLSVGQRSDEYFRYYGARRVVRSPHFVDNARFAAAAAAARPDRAALRAALGIPADAIVALFAGKLIDRKRPIDLLRAVERVDGVHALFVGDGARRASLEAMARAAGARAHFAGFRNQGAMAEAYAVADVLVLPSDARETWGLVVNEAMASGIPAIVSDAVGCAPDLIVPGVTGAVYPAGDVGALARVLAALAADPSSAERMGASAARHIAAWSVDRAADGVLAGAAQ